MITFFGCYPHFAFHNHHGPDHSLFGTRHGLGRLSFPVHIGGPLIKYTFSNFLKMNKIPIKPQSQSHRIIRSSKRVPLIQRIAFAAESRVKYSTKQNPHGVWKIISNLWTQLALEKLKWKNSGFELTRLTLSRPMTTRFKSPHLLNNSVICSSVV